MYLYHKKVNGEFGLFFECRIRIFILRPLRIRICFPKKEGSGLNIQIQSPSKLVIRVLISQSYWLLYRDFILRKKVKGASGLYFQSRIQVLFLRVGSGSESTPPGSAILPLWSESRKENTYCTWRIRFKDRKAKYFQA